MKEIIEKNGLRLPPLPRRRAIRLRPRQGRVDGRKTEYRPLSTRRTVCSRDRFRSHHHETAPRDFLRLSLGFVVPAAQASDVSWIFRPGYYTHSPVTGQRVAQYEPERPSIVPTDPTYQESGYRHQLYSPATID